MSIDKLTNEIELKESELNELKNKLEKRKKKEYINIVSDGF